MITIFKRLFSFAVASVIFIGLCFGALDLYFTHFYHINERVLSAAKLRYQQKSIHPLTYEQIPLSFRQAIIATEDRRFSTDPGIDPIGIVRSIVVDVKKDGYTEGASTITQQVIDNTVMSRNKVLTQKMIQAAYAIGLYDTLPKADVFSLYANVIYFGHGAYGLYNASLVYFHRPPSALNDGELTLLAGLPNSPTNYDPYHAMNLARNRQRIVLQNMVDSGILTLDGAKKILQEPIRLA